LWLYFLPRQIRWELGVRELRQRETADAPPTSAANSG
jgi:hypothetical protein